MRDVAFRVYDKRLKVMRKDVVDPEDAPGNNIIIQFTDGEWSLCTKTGYGYDTPCNKKNAILMQYSGLNDKNGKKIFEGDIVRAPYYYYMPDNAKRTLGIVKFGTWKQDGSGGEYNPEECFGWFVKMTEYEYNFHEEVSILEMLKELEVIGNIYENPELIKA